MTLTFQELEEKYKQASHYLEVNEALCFGNRVTRKNPALARWFYEASKEWEKDYKNLATKYFLQQTSTPESGIISRKRNSLIDRVEFFKKRIEEELAINLN